MIYISSPSESLPVDEAKANIWELTQRIFEIGALVINPMTLGIPDKWMQFEKDNKRKEVILRQATALFLQRDWTKSDAAKKEFIAVSRHNRDRKNRFIHIYFEDFYGLSDLQSDIREGIIIPEIPAA